MFDFGQNKDDLPPTESDREIGDGLGWMISRAFGVATEPFPDSALPHLIQVPCVVCVIGRRGSGKTALGFRILEIFRYHTWPKFVVGAPRSARHQLPTWIRPISSLWDLPEGAIALIDQAQLNSTVAQLPMQLVAL